MKTRSFLAFAVLAALPCFASADTLWVSSGPDQPKDTIGFAAAGTVYVPGTSGTTGVASPGAAYATVTVADFNGNDVPDLMAMAVAATHGTEKPGTIIVGGMNGKGKILWTAELDDAMVYQMHFPSRKEGDPNGIGRFSITFASPVPLQSSIENGLPTGQRRHVPLAVAISVPAVQDPATSVSDFTITFPATVAPPGTASPAPQASVPGIVVTTPSNVDDGFAEWMSSVIKNGADVRPSTLTYTFSDGSSFSIVLDMQISSLDFSTTGNKTAELDANLDQEGGTFNPGGD